MENFDRENIDELLEIRQYFPHQKFAPYGTSASPAAALVDWELRTLTK